MTINYDKKIQVKKYEIKISSKSNYGYFEHDIYGEEDGGSFFIEDGEVVDIDACFCIPNDVADGIEELGYAIDRDLLCEEGL